MCQINLIHRVILNNKNIMGPFWLSSYLHIILKYSLFSIKSYINIIVFLYKFSTIIFPFNNFIIIINIIIFVIFVIFFNKIFHYFLFLKFLYRQAKKQPPIRQKSKISVINNLNYWSKGIIHAFFSNFNIPFFTFIIPSKMYPRSKHKHTIVIFKLLIVLFISFIYQTNRPFIMITVPNYLPNVIIYSQS